MLSLGPCFRCVIDKISSNRMVAGMARLRSKYISEQGKESIYPKWEIFNANEIFALNTWQALAPQREPLTPLRDHKEWCEGEGHCDCDRAQQRDP